MSGDDALDSFLSKVDEVNAVIKDMASGKEGSFEKADEVIGEAESVRIKAEATHINNSSPTTVSIPPQQQQEVSPEQMSQAAFMAQIESDAKARKERREKGREESEAFRLKGNEKFKRGDFVGAVAEYTQALQLYPDSVILYTNRAQTHLKMSRFSEALNDTKWALRLHDKHPKALLRRGLALRGLNRFDEALEALDRAKKAALKDKRKPMETYLKETRAMKEVYERDLAVHAGLPSSLKNKSRGLFEACENVIKAFQALQDVVTRYQLDISCPNSSPQEEAVKSGEGDNSQRHMLPESLTDLTKESREWILEGAKATNQALQTVTKALHSVTSKFNGKGRRAGDGLTIAETGVVDWLRVNGGVVLVERIIAVDVITKLCRDMDSQARLAFVSNHAELVEKCSGTVFLSLAFLQLACKYCDIFCVAIAKRGDSMRKLSLLPFTPLPNVQQSSMDVIHTILSVDAARESKDLACFGMAKTLWELVQARKYILISLDVVLNVLSLLSSSPLSRSDINDIVDEMIEYCITTIKNDNEEWVESCGHLLLQLSCDKKFALVEEKHMKGIALAMDAMYKKRERESVLGVLLGLCTNIGLHSQTGLDTLQSVKIHELLHTILMSNPSVAVTVNVTALLARLCSSKKVCSGIVEGKGALASLVRLLSTHQHQEVQSNVLRCLAKILSAVEASRKQVWAVAAQTFSAFEPFTKSSNDNVAGNACLCLSFLFLEKDIINKVDIHAVDALLTIAKTAKNPSVQKNATVAAARLCQHPEKMQRLRELDGFSILHARG
eukprot:m.102840 g.102840  ORF g.102840 m.102840 type:complete len:785 (-) comp12601_c0_seq6:133-2487(-)